MNALPLKNQMKNVFRGNQIFTKFYLHMLHVTCISVRTLLPQGKSLSSLPALHAISHSASVGSRLPAHSQ